MTTPFTQLLEEQKKNLHTKIVGTLFNVQNSPKNYQLSDVADKLMKLFEEERTTALTKGYELALEEVEKWNQDQLDFWHTSALYGEYDNGRMWQAKETQQFLLTHIAHLKETI